MRGGACEVEVEVEVEARCLTRPVHSGQKGGPVPDPVQVLCRLLVRLADAEGEARVVAFDSQPVRGAANQIVDSARARILLHTAPGRDPRRAAARLMRSLTQDPPWRAHVRARIVR